MLPLLPALRSADSDLADAVERFFAADISATSAGDAVAASDRRTLELWHESWAKWASCVGELGDTEGAYANQERHWHPPEFDPTALAADLELAALTLAPQLERAFALLNQPDWFERAVTEIDAGIASYPDTMYAEEDVCVLGPHATRCVLHWLWLAVAAEPAPGAALAERFWPLENGLVHVALDVEAGAKFFADLPEAAAREAHTWPRQPAVAEADADTRSVWHRVRLDYDRRFDPAAHLRGCEESLGRNWRYGEPLIADALARGDLVAAEDFLTRTAGSLLRLQSDEPWIPEQPLMEFRRYGWPEEEQRALVALLAQWAEIAERAGQPARAASCRLQLVLWSTAGDWPPVFAAFEQFAAAGGDAAVGETLFTAWCDYEVACCGLAPWGTKRTTARGDSWLHRLLDARRHPAAARPELLSHLATWLDQCREHWACFKQHWSSLALFTRSRAEHGRIASEYPAFSLHVLRATYSMDTVRAKSVSDAMATLGLDDALASPLPIWREHLHLLEPSPAHLTSLYTEPAKWMKALAELNRPRYDTVLAQRRTEFHRRRNLWRDLKAAHCPEV